MCRIFIFKRTHRIWFVLIYWRWQFRDDTFLCGVSWRFPAAYVSTEAVVAEMSSRTERCTTRRWWMSFKNAASTHWWRICYGLWHMQKPLYFLIYQLFSKVFFEFCFLFAFDFTPYPDGFFVYWILWYITSNFLKFYLWRSVRIKIRTKFFNISK